MRCTECGLFHRSWRRVAQMLTGRFRRRNALVDDPKWHVDARYGESGRLQVGFLVVEENVRPQYLYNGTLVDAAEEERIVYGHSPSLKTGDGAFVRGRVPRGDNRHADSLGVDRILVAVLFLAFLNLVDVAEEVA